MTQKALFDYLEALPDPRQQAKCSHVLSEVIFMTLCAMMCGFDTGSEIALFAQERQKILPAPLSANNLIISMVAGNIADAGNSLWVSRCPICQKWKAKTIIAVQSERTEKGRGHDFVRFYISSQPMNAEKALQATRSHWSVENHLHGSLDVAFREDKLQARMGFAGENLAVLRKWILNMLKQNKSRNLSMENKRRLCCLNDDYLFESLSLFI
ncbi:ISAs1 family transposase [Photorhabdus khanii]